MLSDSDKNYRLEIDLVCDIELASRITQQILKQLLTSTDMENIENLVLRDNKYNTLATFYPHHNLISQLKKVREEQRKEFEHYRIEPPVVMDGIPEDELVKIEEEKGGF